jgi:hypothetical protein
MARPFSIEHAGGCTTNRGLSCGNIFLEDKNPELLGTIGQALTKGRHFACCLSHNHSMPAGCKRILEALQTVGTDFEPPRPWPLDEIAAKHGVVPCTQDRGDDAHRQILLGFPKTLHAGAEAGEGGFWWGIHSSETRHDRLFVDFSLVVPMKTAGETPKRFARWRICRMLSSRSPERISDTTPWLPISGSSDCVKPCASISDRKTSGPVASRIWHGSLHTSG